MESNRTVRMVQRSNLRWELLGPKDNVLAEGLFHSRHDAEVWVKCYISSFLGWNYVILNQETKWTN